METTLGSRVRNLLTKSLELSEDQIGVSRPNEGLRVYIIGIEILQ